MSFEVGEPIQNSPFEEPLRHWYVQEGETPRLIEGERAGRRSDVFDGTGDRKLHAVRNRSRPPTLSLFIASKKT